MTASWIYWVSRLDNVIAVLGGLDIVAGIAATLGLALMVGCKINDIPEDIFLKISTKMFKWSFPFVIILTLMLLFIPTTKQAIAMKFGPSVYNVLTQFTK